MENSRTPFVIHKSISINGSPYQVWRALTDPNMTRKYFFNCEVISDWKQGSAITFKGRLFLVKKIELKGKILKIEPERLLQYNLVNPSDKSGGSVSTVTDEILLENGKTILKVTDDVGQGKGAEKRYKRSQKGWEKVLRGLKKLVEQNN